MVFSLVTRSSWLFFLISHTENFAIERGMNFSVFVLQQFCSESMTLERMKNSRSIHAFCTIHQAIPIFDYVIFNFERFFFSAIFLSLATTSSCFLCNAAISWSEEDSFLDVIGILENYKFISSKIICIVLKQWSTTSLPLFFFEWISQRWSWKTKNKNNINRKLWIRKLNSCVYMIDWLSLWRAILIDFTQPHAFISCIFSFRLFSLIPYERCINENGK